MKRASTSKSSGFTIVETMIALAVSMALFLGAVLLINGKQHTTAFNQGIRSLQTQFKQTIGEVSSGYFVNDGSLKCVDGGGFPDVSSSGTDMQGTNIDCLFLGKVIQFGVPGVNDEGYNVYTVVGLKKGVTGGTVSLNASGARVIARSSVDTTPVPDMYDTHSLPYGMKVSSTYYTTHPGSVASVGFITNLTNLGDSDGSQLVSVVPVTSTTLGKDKSVGATEINANIDTSPIDPANGARICFNSGGTNQSVLFQIGGSGRQGNVDTQIFNHKDCI
jgi:hypothetical protein